MPAEGKRMHLDSFRRISLAHLPTPLELLPRLTEHLGGPGSTSNGTTRPGWHSAETKLENSSICWPTRWRQDCDTLVTTGGPQSNHAHQTAAAAAARTGLRTGIAETRAVGDAGVRAVGECPARPPAPQLVFPNASNSRPGRSTKSWHCSGRGERSLTLSRPAARRRSVHWAMSWPLTSCCGRPRSNGSRSTRSWSPQARRHARRHIVGARGAARRTGARLCGRRDGPRKGRPRPQAE